MALSTEERNLIARAVRRDREAFAQIYVQYHDVVFRRVLPIVNGKDEAEDVTGETFLRAWNAVSRFQDRDVPISAWLCKIAERRAYEHLRKGKRVVGLEAAWAHHSESAGPEEMAERDAEATEVRRALVKLPHVQREVLSQRFLKGLGYNDVATSLGKPVGTVRVIQHRALAALRAIISEDRLRASGPPPTGGGVK